MIYHSDDDKKHLVVEFTPIEEQGTFNNTQWVVSNILSSAIILKYLKYHSKITYFDTEKVLANMINFFSCDE